MDGVRNRTRQPSDSSSFSLSPPPSQPRPPPGSNRVTPALQHTMASVTVTSDQELFIPITTSAVRQEHTSVVRNEHNSATLNMTRTPQVPTSNVYPLHQIMQHLREALMSNTISRTPLPTGPTPIRYAHTDSLVLPLSAPAAYSTVGFTFMPYALTNVIEPQLDTIQVPTQPVVLKHPPLQAGQTIHSGQPAHSDTVYSDPASESRNRYAKVREESAARHMPVSYTHLTLPTTPYV